jgi:hypothetical protein
MLAFATAGKGGLGGNIGEEQSCFCNGPSAGAIVAGPTVSVQGERIFRRIKPQHCVLELWQVDQVLIDCAEFVIVHIPDRLPWHLTVEHMA